MKSRAITLTLALSAVFATSAALADARTVDDRATATSSKTKIPIITLALDKPSYAPGATMTLSVTENIWVKRTFKIVDTSGATWTQKSDNDKVVKFTSSAVRAGEVTVTMTRTFDRATATARISYAVPTAPGSQTPPPPPVPSVPSDKAQWPGHQPGKFYLGMSCGTDCTTKSAELGQGYGVHRQFNQWADWRGVAKNIQEDHAADRLPWVSVKPPNGDATGWRAIASGSQDAEIRALATTLKDNDDSPILITFHHEPGNDGTEAEGVDWAAAYVRFHDVLKAEGALANVADPPIMSDWLFNPTNRAQDPDGWLTPAVLARAPFVGVDVYENASGETMAQRIPRVLAFLADRGYPDMMVGVGETGSTDAAHPDNSAVQWLNDSLSWVAAHPDQVGVVSYFNSVANSKPDVYWPLDESTAKMNNYRDWLNKSVTID